MKLIGATFFTMKDVNFEKIITSLLSRRNVKQKNLVFIL